MSNKLVVETLHRSLRDITGKDETKSGTSTLLYEDFRQILLVVHRGTRADIVNSCLKRFTLWSSIKTMKLTKNMRVRKYGDVEAGHFAHYLQDLGSENASICKDTIFVGNFGSCVTNTQDLIDAFFPNVVTNHSDPEWLAERAILALLNKIVRSINKKMIEMMPGG
ncbi:hypothetical protein RRG08_058136 [Elysia crispata]|uniref:ATP-dependent DNA helicase n=1 Tax=Elysia crispata TaxID=231223 RepID=A0AAE1AGH6_9GAST|nr:hypothetical protein RRG08_058136 [Elysia crispata]